MISPDVSGWDAVIEGGTGAERDVCGDAAACLRLCYVIHVGMQTEITTWKPSKLHFTYLGTPEQEPVHSLGWAGDLLVLVLSRG